MKPFKEIVKNVLDKAPTPRNEFLAASCGALAVAGTVAFAVELAESQYLVLPNDFALATISAAAFINHLRKVDGHIDH